MTLDKTSRPLETTAAAVSSHELSIPRMSVGTYPSFIIRFSERMVPPALFHLFQALATRQHSVFLPTAFESANTSAITQ
jgi:hypothetical protein